MSDTFDPENVHRMVAVTVVKVGEPAMIQLEDCACGEHWERYYVYGPENHYVRAADFDALLKLYREVRKGYAECQESGRLNR